MQRSSKFDISKVCARVTWHMARHHDWGKWTPIDVILNNGLTDEEKNYAKQEILPELKQGTVPFILYRQDALRLDGEKRRHIAYFLRDIGGYSELQINATVSRFEGFDSTSKPQLDYFNS